MENASDSAAQGIAAVLERMATGTLLVEMMRSYASHEMYEAKRCLQPLHDETRDAGGLSAYFKSLAGLDNTNKEKWEEINMHRRRASQFYWAIMRLCQRGLLDLRLVADTFGPECFEFFLDVVDPLDQAHREIFKRQCDLEGRQFFTELRSLCSVQ